MVVGRLYWSEKCNVKIKLTCLYEKIWLYRLFDPVGWTAVGC